MARNYYQVLGVPIGANSIAIKKKYRQLIELYHPDKNSGDLAMNERCAKINEAYSVLGDQEKRAAYDLATEKSPQVKSNNSTIPVPIKKPPVQNRKYTKFVYYMISIITIIGIRAMVDNLNREPRQQSVATYNPPPLPLPETSQNVDTVCNSCLECQQALLSRGYTIGSMGADGICGPLTQAAWSKCYNNGVCKTPTLNVDQSQQSWNNYSTLPAEFQPIGNVDLPFTNDKSVHVKSYYRKDGSYVNSYNRSAPGRK